MSATKYLLGEDAIPTHWINLLPDLPGEPLPPLSPQTGEPAGPDDLTPIFPMGLIAQEVSAEPKIGNGCSRTWPMPSRSRNRKWMPPTWSSWPCVATNPAIWSA